MKIQDALNLLNLTGTVSKSDIKKAYRTASLKYHPDRNPAGKEMMQAINEAYEALKDLEEVEANEDAAAYDFAEQLSEALNMVINLAGLEIEVCGNWVWLSGDTKTHKEEIKAAGFKWAKKKVMWYFRPDDYKSSARGGWSIDKIRELHGSTKVKSQYRTALN
jgi:curved DNA-binding protein CbpA